MLLVLDRIDRSLEFPMPDIIAREELVKSTSKICSRQLCKI